MFDPPRAAPDFALQGSDGSELKLSRYRGKVVLLGIRIHVLRRGLSGNARDTGAAHKQLGAQAGEMQVVYITVDPERDDAAQMKKYLSSFDPTFVGGTGSEQQLAAVRKEYGIAAEKVAGPDGSFTHSSFVYLIDRGGRMRALMPYGHSADDYVHDVRILLASP